MFDCILLPMICGSIWWKYWTVVSWSTSAQLFPIRVQWHHAGSLELATWEYLHHGSGQMLQIKTSFETPPVGKHLPAHYCFHLTSIFQTCASAFEYGSQPSSRTLVARQSKKMQILPLQLLHQWSRNECWMNQSRVPSLNEEVQPTSNKSLQKRDYKDWERAYIWKGRLRIVQNESSQVNNN